jgi:uncharacterized membrane protein YjjP (DUF1212 family)
LLREEFYQRIRFIVQFGRALHSVGSPAHSLEAALLALCQRLGLKGAFVSIPTAIFCSFRFLDEEVTRIVRIEPSGINLGRLTQTDAIAQRVIRGEVGFEEGSQQLEEIFNRPERPNVLLTALCFLLTSAGMMTLFGGTWGDFLASALIGAIIGVLSQAKSFGLVAQLYEVFMALMATVLAMLCARVSADMTAGVIILASLIIFIPGLNITISIAEIATQNLTSGTSRLVGGLMILLKLTFGVFMGTKLASVIPLGTGEWSFAKIPDWVTILSVPVTAAMSTIVFKAEARDLKWVTLAGVYGYALSKVGTFYFGPEMGLFIGGVGVGVGANLFARLQSRPSSVFQFPGLILLVPGSVGYRGLSYLYERNVVMGFDTAFTMLALAFSLVMGVFVGNILLKPRTNFLD